MTDETLYELSKHKKIRDILRDILLVRHTGKTFQEDKTTFVTMTVNKQVLDSCKRMCKLIEEDIKEIEAKEEAEGN